MKFYDRHLSASRFCIKITLALLLMAVICSIIVLSWVPPVSRDALTHHLAVPKLYLQHGGIYEIPSMSFSYYPMNLDFLYIIPLYFGNDIIPKFIHFLFALLTAWLIYGFLKKRIGTSWALTGVVFFLSLPIIVKLSITVYVDLGLIFFSTAALICLLKWIENRFRYKWLLFSAVSCGLALGTKYNGLIVLFLLTVFVPLAFIRGTKKDGFAREPIDKRRSVQQQFKAIGLGVFFVFIALIIFSPWMIRNYIWQSNPVYPLYNSWFNPVETVKGVASKNSLKQDLSAEQIKNKRKSDTGLSTFAVRKILYQEQWWQIMLIPVRIFFQGQDDNPKYFDGKLSPFLFFLPLVAFWPSKRESESLRVEKRILVAFAILFILFALSQTSIRIRYIAPVIPPLVILSVFGLKRIVGMGGIRRTPGSAKLAAAVGITAAVVMLGANAAYIYNQFNYVHPFGYISGQISRDDYITRYRSEYPAMQYANRNLHTDAKILALFLGNRRYYSDREMIFGNNLFLRIVKKVDSAQDVAHDLQQRGFTHLLIRYDLFNNWTEKQFGDREKKMLKVFFSRDVKPLLSKNGYGLFELQFIQ